MENFRFYHFQTGLRGSPDTLPFTTLRGRLPKCSTFERMPQIARQKLAMLVAAGLDLLALGLFFVQAAVDDTDWIKDEFADFQFWDSISDLAVRHPHDQPSLRLRKTATCPRRNF
jgi:hypothetical protein